MPFTSDVGTGKRLTIRKCKVCILPDKDRDAIERAMRKQQQVDGRMLSAQAVVHEREIPISQPLLSRHKTECMGLLDQARRNVALVPGEAPLPTAPLLKGRELWDPKKVRERGRLKYIELLAKLEVKLDTSPTAAYFQVALNYLDAIQREADKIGGDPKTQMKSYMDETREKIESKRVKVTRKVTMEETVTREAEQAIEGQVVVLPCE
jgi:hypothetical protein